MRIKLRYLVRSGGPNFIPSVRGPVRLVRSEKYTQPALTLGAYSYAIKYKSGKQQGNVDSPVSVPIPAETVAVMEHLSIILLTAAKIKQATERDPTLSKVKRYTLLGWPATLGIHEADLKPYFSRRNELSLEDNVLLWGNCVVVPFCFQPRVMDVLHSTHIGTSRMKSLAWQYVWWPKIDSDIEAKVRGCSTCAVAAPDPPPTVLYPWEWPQKPCLRVHVDYAGPFLGKMFLLLVDSHSKWMEVHITNASITAVTYNRKVTVDIFKSWTSRGPRHRQWPIIFQ